MSRAEQIEALKGLLERVDVAIAPDQGLDEDIHAALRPDDPWWQAICEGRCLVAAGRSDEYVELPSTRMRADSWATGARIGEYSGSVDAALRLMEHAAPGWVIERISDQASGKIGNLKPFGAHVEISDGQHEVSAQAASRPLAICRAVFFAKLALLTQEAGDA